MQAVIFGGVLIVRKTLFANTFDRSCANILHLQDVFCADICVEMTAVHAKSSFML